MTYWIVVTADNGRTFLHKVGFSSERKAERVVEEEYHGTGKIIPTDSSDRVKAAQEIRDQLAKSSQPGWGRNFKHG